MLENWVPRELKKQCLMCGSWNFNECNCPQTLGKEANITKSKEMLYNSLNKFTAYTPSGSTSICKECGQHHDEHYVQRMSCTEIWWSKELNRLISALMKIEDMPNHPDLVPPDKLVKWMQDRAINALANIGKENEN